MFRFVSIIFVTISAVKSQDSIKYLTDYFENDDVQNLRSTWAKYKTSMDQAIATALQDTTGKAVMNLMIMNVSGLELATGYFHDHGPVQVILSDLHLAKLPECWLPNISISLASNIVKIKTKLSNMVINAGYNILRNRSEIINDAKKQHSNMNSPFLLQAVKPTGNVALTLQGCVLSGYVIAKLQGKLVSLGHHKLTFSQCDYIIEIYQRGDMSPPVISRFSSIKNNYGLEIKHLLMKPINEEVTQKLQGAIFSIINTSAILGQNNRAIQDKQDQLFRNTLNSLSAIVQELNKKIGQNSSAVLLDDLCVTWDDITPHDVHYLVPKQRRRHGGIILSDMILTGLDTAYLSNRGGPYKLDGVMIGEQLRFNTLQVRGYGQHTFLNEDRFEFAVEISDFDVNIDKEMTKSGLVMEMAGFRKIEFVEPNMIFKSAKAIVIGHLLNVVPKAIQSILTSHLSFEEFKMSNPYLAERPDFKEPVSEDEDVDGLSENEANIEESFEEKNSIIEANMRFTKRTKHAKG